MWQYVYTTLTEYNFFLKSYLKTKEILYLSKRWGYDSGTLSTERDSLQDSAYDTELYAKTLQELEFILFDNYL